MYQILIALKNSAPNSRVQVAYLPYNGAQETSVIGTITAATSSYIGITETTSGNTSYFLSSNIRSITVIHTPQPAE